MVEAGPLVVGLAGVEQFVRRAGRQAVAETRRRGHQATAVVRDPAAHGDPTDVRVVAGDVTGAGSVEYAAAGHNTAISAAARLLHRVVPRPATGLAKAGVHRLVAVGLASILPGASGAPLTDEPGYPNEYRPFFLLRTCDLDWAYVAPAGDSDHAGTPTGRYRLAEDGDPAGRLTYADFAIALLDEIEAPRHHSMAVGVREAW